MPSENHSSAIMKLIRLPEVIDRVNLSRSYIYQLISMGEFPKPIKLGARAVGWLDSEITQWIKQRVINSRKEAA